MKKTYFPHDSNARNDIKLIKVRQKYSYEGFGIYFALIELLFTENNNLCVKDFNTLAFGLQCDAEILKDIVLNFDLFVVEGDCFHSKRLSNTIDEINNKSIKASENAKKRWNNATAMQPHKGVESNSNASKVNKSKVNKTKVNERIKAFKNAINDLDFMDKEDKQDFYLYWSELNKSQSKMRWETERTWSLNLRAKRWINNGFNKQKKTYPDYYDGQLMKKMDQSAKKEYENHLLNLGYTTSYNPNSGITFIKK